MKTEQGEILRVEGLGDIPAVVVSKNSFNEGEGVLLCPVVQAEADNFLHIAINVKNCSGTVLCEQVRYIDLSRRGYKKIGILSYEEIINITDAIQSIVDYI
jgi:mRNA-degrading endonuclease toxin of MazEF toxin-antitoxin module